MKKYILVTVVILAIISSVVIAIFFKVNNHTNIAEQFVEAVEAEDIDGLKRLLQTEKADVFLDVPLEQFLQYTYKNAEKLRAIEKSIQEQMDNGEQDLSAIVQLKSGEKKYGIFPTYYLTLRESQLEISHFDGEIIDVKTDHAILNRRHVDSWFYGPIYSGEHLIQIQVEHELGQFTVEKQVEIWDKAVTKIQLDEEEILLQDEFLKRHLYELGAVFTKQLVELTEYENQDNLFSNPSEDEEQLLFQEVVINESSYNLLYIEDSWYAEVRMIGTYDDRKSKSDDPVLMLFTFEMMFDPYDQEWFISDVDVSPTEQSVMDLWDNHVKFKREDLKSDHQVDKVL